MDRNLEITQNIIRSINENHKSFSEKFVSEVSYNLKKIRVSDLFEDKDMVIKQEYLEYIFQYVANINTIFLELNELIFEFHEYNPRFRIKQRESIENKLYYYLKLDHQGKSPLNKCLNDLVGFRILLDDFNGDSEEMIVLLNQLSERFGLRYYNRKEGMYVGTHVYFKNKNNRYFPWELQLWDKRQNEENIKSHENHKAKRSYTKWPKQYKAGKTEGSD